MLETRLRKTGDSVDGGAITTGLHNIIGTSNQVIVASGTNTVLTNDVTLSLPQDIGTSSSPTFATPIVTGLTIGANTLTTSEWAFLDGQDQSVFTTSAPQFTRLGLSTAAHATRTLDVLKSDSSYENILLTNSKSDITTQRVGIASQHYTAAEEPVSLVNMIGNGTVNLLRIGGGLGTENAATSIEFYTASAINTLT